MLVSNTLFCYADNIDITTNELKEQKNTEAQVEIIVDGVYRDFGTNVILIGGK